MPKQKEYLPLQVARLLTFDQIKDQLFEGAMVRNHDAFFLQRLKSELDVLDENQAIMLSTRLSVADSDSFFPCTSQIFCEPKEAKTEILDLFATSAMLEYWKKNKQVYQLDPDFSDALMKTDGLKIYPELLKRLPYQHFYLDTKNLKGFGKIKGLFISVFVAEDLTAWVFIVRVFEGKDEPHFIMDHIRGGKGTAEEPYFTLDRSGIPKLQEIGDPFLDDPSAEDENSSEYQGDYQSSVLLVYQLLMYMVSQEPDISENPDTARTYKPSSTIRNKFSEIRKWDVGVRYGNKIRLLERKAETEENPAEEATGVKEGSSASRKPPRPHSVCAHWQRYHTGKGRKNIELRWKEPFFSGAKKADDLPAVVHKIEP